MVWGPFWSEKGYSIHFAHFGLACSRRSDSRAREKNSGRKNKEKGKGKKNVPPPFPRLPGVQFSLPTDRRALLFERPEQGDFGLESRMVFEATTGVYERIYRFNSKWVRKKENASSKRIWNFFCLRSNLSVKAGGGYSAYERGGDTRRLA